MSYKGIDNQERLVMQQYSYNERSRMARKARIQKRLEYVGGIVCTIILVLVVALVVVYGMANESTGYWAPNPVYENPVDTPWEDPCIWVEE